jgi:hypothetical protein
MPVFASLVEFDFDADFDARACGEPEVGEIFCAVATAILWYRKV